MFLGYKNGKKVGVLFSGGPASAANTVISSAVLAFHTPMNAPSPISVIPKNDE